MKKSIISVLAVVLTVLFALTACTQAPIQDVDVITPEGTPEMVEPAPAEGIDEPVVGGETMVNPLISYASFAELMEAMPNVIMSDVPEGATDVVYQQISTSEPPIAEIIFTYSGYDYCYRAAFADDAYSADISGVYTEFAATEDDVTPAAGATEGGNYTLFYDNDSPEALAVWYYEPTHCQYSLYTKTGDGEDENICDLMDILLPITTDSFGNELDLSGLDGNMETTMLAANAENGLDLAGQGWKADEINGTVVNVLDNAIIVNMENGNTLTFMLTYIDKTDASAGDSVTVKYIGDVVNSPEAVEIIVTKKATATTHTISGYITQFDSKEVFIKTTSNNIYGFKLASATKITGLATALQIGYDVKLTYKGEVTTTPDAIEINVTATNRAIKDPLVNKSIKGLVTKIKSKSVTIFAENNHTYVFKKDKTTSITGNYTLAAGCTIEVTYDGYASDTPLAKKINVIAPKDPTPVSPTPVPTLAPATSRTVTGTITAHQGSTLEIRTDSNVRYSFIIAGAEQYGDSSGNVGDYATVTYKEQAGGVVVSKVVYKAVFTPTPAPIVTEYTVSGYVTSIYGYSLEMMSNEGYRYSFYFGGARVSGNSSGYVGDDVTVTYKVSNSDTTVTKVVFTTQYVPEPTPYYEEYTIKGVITYYYGNMLGVYSNEGYQYDFYIADAHVTGDSDCVEGDTATVTFILNDWGEQVVSKVKFTKTVYDAG